MSFFARRPLGGRFSLTASSAFLALTAASPAFAQAKLQDLEHRGWPTISVGTSLNGSLNSSDVVREDQTYTDGFLYDAQQGETATFTMRSPDFSAWLVVDDPASSFLEDDSGADGAAQLTVTFPHAGRYLILANSVTAHSSGTYTLSVSRDGQQSGSSAVSNTPTGAKATLADLEHHSWPAVLPGASVNGRLDSSDVVRDDGSYTDGFLYNGQQGETITVTMRSADFDSWLVVDDPNGALHQSDDDSGGGHDSRIKVTLPHAGRYLILANVINSATTGNYSLTVTSDRQGSGTTVASNQGPSEDWARCADDDNKYPLDVQIGACTKLLQSGQLNDDSLADAYVDRGITFQRENNHDRAIADFTDALRLRPNDAKALAMRGASEFELQRRDAASTDFQAALAVDPNNADALNGAGRLKMLSKDFAQARDLFTRAIGNDSTDKAAPLYANRGAAAYALGDRDQALADYGQALRMDPKDEFVLRRRGNLYEELHRYSDARADFDRLVELYPSAWNHNLACFARAAYLGTELDRAKSECDRAVALDPKNAEILDSRGMLRLKLKQYAGAWSDYDAAIRLDPKVASYWYGRAMAERAQGKIAAARADIAKAKQLDPKIAETYADYGFKP